MKHATRLLSCIVTLAAATTQVWAQAEPTRHGPEGHAMRGEFRLDNRYNHGHYYPQHGMKVVVLPREASHVFHAGTRYAYYGGVWYRPYGRSFVVVAPPFGIAVPFLPLDYVTLRVGTRPYFYANGTYYVPGPGAGYTVVEAPVSASRTEAVQAPQDLAAAPITYPRNGQSAAENARDIDECNQWANAQVGAAGNASVFQRGFAACMDGRGYTVR